MFRAYNSSTLLIVQEQRQKSTAAAALVLLILIMVFGAYHIFEQMLEVHYTLLYHGYTTIRYVRDEGQGANPTMVDGVSLG